MKKVVTLSYISACVLLHAEAELLFSRETGGQLQLSYSGTLQQSSDLIAWSDVQPQPDSPYAAPAPSSKPTFYKAHDDYVVLDVGDDFQAANDSHPAGTVFHIAPGVHSGQRVNGPKKGNQWVGTEGAILDGGETLTDAFHGYVDAIEIRDLTLRHYKDNGMAFQSGQGILIDNVTVEDTGSGDGEGNGALQFYNISDITVTNCHFERVSSAVLPTDCTGPIVIEWNTGLNTGRNFVQLAQITGEGIRVRYNSMERVGDYLRGDAQDVEDWISVYKVYASESDPAQISYNRARGHGPSGSGSFIMMGDAGGSHQEAVGNVGVTCGQVGIGMAAGEYIEVRDNAMYSEVWDKSNVGIYSWNFYEAEEVPAGNHVIIGNRANWLNKDGNQNPFWPADNVSPRTIEGNSFPDPTLTADIWDQWDTDYGSLPH